jgi:Ca-activated chloride channel homolog
MAETYLRDHATLDRRVVLVITDGIDNASVTTRDRIRQQAESARTVVYAVGLFHDQEASRADAGRHELRDLTERTGGAAYFPASVEQVESVAVDLAHRIRNQYTIAYTPLNERADNSYRTIRVTVSGPDRYTVRTRPGYRARAESDETQGR